MILINQIITFYAAKFKRSKKDFSVDGRIVFLHGDICGGKTLVILGALNSLSPTRPIFELQHAYVDLLNEVSLILSIYKNAILVIENCFSLGEDRLVAAARQVSASAGGLILSARSISTEAESGKLKGIRAIPTLVEMQIGKLHPTEIDALIALIDQIAGWRDLRALSAGDRRRFVEIECSGAVPSVLLRLLNSEYVRNKYREEYNKTSYLDARERQMIVAALLIANIGLDAPLSFLSDLFEKDFLSMLKRIAAQGGGLRLVRADGGITRTVPSIGARNLLKNVVQTHDVVNTNIYILEKMAQAIRRTDFERHIFSQLMRYSILSSIISDTSEVNRFFDHISKIAYFREMPLFWLQWHMAMSAQSKWVKAEDYLNMGYAAATTLEKKRGEKYNRKQLDDRKAKFLAARAESNMRTDVDLFRDLKEAFDLVGRLMRDPELTHHPYETLLDIGKVLELRGRTVLDVQRKMLLAQFKGVAEQAKLKLNVVPEGSQRFRASEWLKQVESMIPGTR